MADSQGNIVVGWGDNGTGQATGVPSYPTSNGVTVVTGSPYATGVVMIANNALLNVKSVASGQYHSLAVRSDGTVVGWGGNLFGAAVGFQTPKPYRANDEVKIDGQVLSNIVAVAACEKHSLALKADGTVVAWGDNGLRGSPPPSGLSNVIAVASDWMGNLALKRDGTVVSWGGVSAPNGLSNVVAIAASSGFYGHNLALRKDGTVFQWSVCGSITEKPVQPGLSNVVAISAGGNHSLALKKDGTVYSWVGNAEGSLVMFGGQILSNVTAIAAGNEYSLALKKDGTVVGWGRLPCPVPEGLRDVVSIAAGDDFCLAVTTNRALADKFQK